MAAPFSIAYSGASKQQEPPLVNSTVLQVLRQNFASGPFSMLATVLLLAIAVIFLPAILRWAVLDAVFISEHGEECRAAAGACWAVVPEKYRVILFGTFPYEEHWRPIVAMVVLFAAAILSAIPRFWSRWIPVVWVVAITIAMIMMGGGVLGLSSQSTHNWGGLPLTMLLFLGTVAGGLPTAILLALGRRSHMPVVRLFCTMFIEITRGIPLIVVLFVASLIFPLFLPETMTVDKLLRAQIGMILFFGAYAAEIVRGGLQALPRGQFEAAEAIGLGYWRQVQIIILPQVMRIIAPALMNDVIRAFKNTTFVAILGLFDMLGATKAALEDVEWVRFAPEAYLFIFAIYFSICTTMSEYAKWLERRLEREQAR